MKIFGFIFALALMMSAPAWAADSQSTCPDQILQKDQTIKGVFKEYTCGNGCFLTIQTQNPQEEFVAMANFEGSEDLKNLKAGEEIEVTYDIMQYWEKKLPECRTSNVATNAKVQFAK